MHYLWQASIGELSLINHAKPMKEVIDDPKTPGRLKQLLSEIPAVKAFGEKNGLKPTTNYGDFVNLNRDAAVWVVSACEKLRFKSKEWHFPLVGDFPFLGWFDLDDARDFAKELKAEGWDVDLRGASAYSTLGWFRDPILSTMIPSGDEALGELVNVVIHESVHATLYISGESYFNESLANFSAGIMTEQYLDQKQGPQSVEKKTYVEFENSYIEREKKLHEAYESLGRLYGSAVPDEQKLAEKEKILVHLKEDLKAKRDITNATLVQFKTYNAGFKDFEDLFHACGSDWHRFLKNLSGLTTSSFGGTQQENLAPVLQPRTAAGCAT